MKQLSKAMELIKNYNFHLDIKYPPCSIIDVPGIIEQCKEKWYNQTLTKVNESVVRIGIIEGEFHWHKHSTDDEFFFVIHGKLYIDLEDRTLELEQNQGTTIPRGMLHRPRAPYKTVVLMVETASIQPGGD